jgi:MFS family permease
MRMFRNRASNRALVTQLVQWFVMQGSFFVISVYLQEVHKFNAIQTGLTLTPTTLGILIAGGLAGTLAQTRTQKRLIWAGFVLTITGMILLLLLAGLTGGILASIPGLLLMGLGVGTMLTSSVNVVQSSFPDKDQGEISGLSRSVSNLGSSLGTAIAGSVLVASFVHNFAAAFLTMIVFACIGLIAAILIPADQVKSGTTKETPETAEKA